MAGGAPERGEGAEGQHGDADGQARALVDEVEVPLVEAVGARRRVRGVRYDALNVSKIRRGIKSAFGGPFPIRALPKKGPSQKGPFPFPIRALPNEGPFR